MSDIIDDLSAEHAALDAVVAGLTEDQWLTPTPAQGWSVLDSISHLHYFDGTATQALTDPEAFARHAEALFSADGGLAEADVAIGRELGGQDLLSAWRAGRNSLLAALRAADPTQRVPWYGPPMALRSFATARLMETWAHGVDVTDALGLPVAASERLKSICHISIGARAYSFLVNGVEDPGGAIRCELAGPSGESWTWGPEEATDRVSGPALDLALIATQRRHLDDANLTITGPSATAWLAIAQSFAGPSGGGRQPLAQA
ncbi:MAG: hypothetical protein JWO12_779 [Frankiales bacterium]|nr:hypothetical protein [Frankiales bacterium]